MRFTRHHLLFPLAILCVLIAAYAMARNSFIRGVRDEERRIVALVEQGTLGTAEDLNSRLINKVTNSRHLFLSDLLGALTRHREEVITPLLLLEGYRVEFARIKQKFDINALHEAVSRADAMLVDNDINIDTQAIAQSISHAKRQAQEVMQLRDRPAKQSLERQAVKNEYSAFSAETGEYLKALIDSSTHLQAALSRQSYIGIQIKIDLPHLEKLYDRDDKTLATGKTSIASWETPIADLDARIKELREFKRQLPSTSDAHTKLHAEVTAFLETLDGFVQRVRELPGRKSNLDKNNALLRRIRDGSILADDRYNDFIALCRNIKNDNTTDSHGIWNEALRHYNGDIRHEKVREFDRTDPEDLPLYRYRTPEESTYLSLNMDAAVKAVNRMRESSSVQEIREHKDMALDIWLDGDPPLSLVTLHWAFRLCVSVLAEAMIYKIEHPILAKFKKWDFSPCDDAAEARDKFAGDLVDRARDALFDELDSYAVPPF